jgi:hypothetical protein
MADDEAARLLEDAAFRLLEDAHHLRVHGRRAPDADVAAQAWDRRAEVFLRGRTDGLRDQLGKVREDGTGG